MSSAFFAPCEEYPFLLLGADDLITITIPPQFFDHEFTRIYTNGDRFSSFSFAKIRAIRDQN